MRLLVDAVSGLSKANCRRLRDLAVHIAKGPKRGWWKSVDQVLETFSDQRALKALKGTVNWDQILQAIKQIIEAIEEAKQE